MTVPDDERATIRNSLLGLVLLQLATGVWMMLDRADGRTGGLDMVLLLLAAPSALFAGYLGFKPGLSTLRSGLGPLVGGLLLVSLTSLLLVDYGTLGRSTPAGFAVFVVSVTIGYLRGRAR